MSTDKMHSIEEWNEINRTLYNLERTAQILASKTKSAGNRGEKAGQQAFFTGKRDEAVGMGVTVAEYDATMAELEKWNATPEWWIEGIQDAAATVVTMQAHIDVFNTLIATYLTEAKGGDLQ